MKSKLLGLSLFVITAVIVAAYPSIRGGATGIAGVGGVPAQGGGIDVVFVLDTTGSMGGLIATAKEKIWSIATTMAQAEQAPEIRMGLVGYRDRGDAYVTEIVDLSADLDSMYARLMDFAADGGGDGPEDVNRALDDAVNRISWGQSDSNYKVVFLVGDAPPHMDYQGDPRYPEILAAAATKGIVVNTIQCGDMPQTAHFWQEIARLGGGESLEVGQGGDGVAIATPFDAEIAKMSAELDGTRMYYGTAAEQLESAAKIAATDKVAGLASVESRARRAAFNATASGEASLFGERELIADVQSGRVDLDALPPAAMPEPLQALTAGEQRALIEEAAEKREALQRSIRELTAQRDAFIDDEIEAAGGADDSLDRQLFDVIRAQAAPKGLDYEGGPKY